jgi:hypothetical protein
MARSTILCMELISIFRITALGPNLDCSRGPRRAKPLLVKVGQAQNARSGGCYRTGEDRVPDDGMSPMFSASASFKMHDLLFAEPRVSSLPSFPRVTNLPPGLLAWESDRSVPNFVPCVPKFVPSADIGRCRPMVTGVIKLKTRKPLWHKLLRDFNC